MKQHLPHWQIYIYVTKKALKSACHTENNETARMLQQKIFLYLTLPCMKDHS